jgi:hypothetical protein
VNNPHSVHNSCFPFGQKNRSELLLSLKPHVPFARNGGHHAHWFYRPLSPQGPPCAQRRVAQTCPNQSIHVVLWYPLSKRAFSNQSIHHPNVHFQTRVSIIQTCIFKPKYPLSKRAFSNQSIHYPNVHFNFSKYFNHIRKLCWIRF